MYNKTGLSPQMEIGILTISAESASLRNPVRNAGKPAFLQAFDCSGGSFSHAEIRLQKTIVSAGGE
jgi:hypothetical protein